MIRATTGPKKPVSRLTKTERWARTDQVFSSLGLMAVVVVIPGPDPPPGPLGSGSTPSFLRSSDKARLPISPYLCTDKYVRLIRTFHGHSVILPTSPPVLLRHETQREVVIDCLKVDCAVRTFRPPSLWGSLTETRGVSRLLPQYVDREAGMWCGSAPRRESA